MVEDGLFSIGRAASMSGVSAKTLRYYESLGLIQPKYTCSENGYRFYDNETLLLIPVIKYYQQVGLNLKRIKELISLAGCANHYKYLRQRKAEIQAEKERLMISLASIDDWIQLIIEGELCLQNDSQSKQLDVCQIVSVKYYNEETSYCQIKQPFSYSYKESIINLEWIRYLENHHLEVSGPVILKYDSHIQKIDGNIETATILQHCIPESTQYSSFGGFMGLCCYHIGSLNNINETYEKILNYASKNNYSLKDECFERHVIDYWVTQNQEEFVTEVIIPILTKDEITENDWK